MYYVFLFHSNSCCTNAPQYYILRTLRALFLFWFVVWVMRIHLVQCGVQYPVSYTTLFCLSIVTKHESFVFLVYTQGDSLVSIHDRSLFLIKSKGHVSFSRVGPLLHLHTLQQFIVDQDKCSRIFLLYRPKPRVLYFANSMEQRESSSTSYSSSASREMPHIL